MGTSYTYTNAECGITASLTLPLPVLPTAPGTPALSLNVQTQTITVLVAPPADLSEALLGYVLAISTDGTTWNKQTVTGVSSSFTYQQYRRGEGEGGEGGIASWDGEESEEGAVAPTWIRSSTLDF